MKVSIRKLFFPQRNTKEKNVKKEMWSSGKHISRITNDIPINFEDIMYADYLSNILPRMR